MTGTPITGTSGRSDYDLDRRLARTLCAAGPFTPARSAHADRAEAFPQQSCDVLDGLGLSAGYVPVPYGGTWSDHERLLRQVRAVAAKDMTVAVAHVKTFLGAAPVWISGDGTQAGRLADAVRAGRPVSWALSEPDHGADLLAGEVTARPVPRGYRLDGVKWLINNATRSTHVCVLARTGPASGSRAHSLFLVDKSALAEESYAYLPKFRTVGIRGADISGIAFHDAVLPVDALVGREGTGVETVLRALQLTRTVATGLSLGAAEHALRLAVRFAGERIIQSRPLIERPNVRRTLTRCLAVLLASEAACTLAARGAHVLTGEMSVISATVKASVPTWTDWVIKELAELLGARSFLDSTYADGMFQKLQRDHQIVGIFDGSTVVNRAALIGQFPRLARGYTEGREDTAALVLAASAGGGLPPLDTSRLVLSAPHGCSAVQALPRVVAEEAAGVPAVTRLGRCADELHLRLADVAPGPFPPMAAFELAEAYEALFAAAACLHLWRAARHGDSGWWLALTLAELLPRLTRSGSTTDVGTPPGSGAEAEQAAMDWLIGTVAADAPLSLRHLLLTDDEGGRP
ncbi:acyl-CoA dehydrogenase [Streptomyces sp. NPDC005538]|uniref:acyl-CoA dehydrogenase n=1 Tax=unclassified Streptomyces TaxID=2593676 RepID=UPI0033A72BBA